MKKTQSLNKQQSGVIRLWKYLCTPLKPNEGKEVKKFASINESGGISFADLPDDGHTEPKTIGELIEAGKETHYTCELCNGVFQKGWSDEEAEQECKDNFGTDSDNLEGGAATVCDPCYRKLNAHFGFGF